MAAKLCHASVTLITVSILSALTLAAERTNSVYSSDKLNVHIIAHSHDDPGWIKTVDQYYYGSDQELAKGAVQFILDTVTTELASDPDKRFVYAEMAFLHRWWLEQDNATQERVRTLVADDRLQFVSGGWCMNDEATTHYSAIIDQMSLGHSFIEAEFGAHARPRVAWQIDPFGHSAEQAALFADMAFDGLYLSRIDYEDKAMRLKEARLEMVWRGSPVNKGELSDLFTGVFYNHYSPPDQFCFDERCKHPVVVKSDPRLVGENVKSFVGLFVAMVDEYRKAYRTNHLLMPMGDDFNFANARQNYKNIDALLAGLTADGRVNAFYSTPLQYLEAINEEGLEWELKTDDFLPYADHPHSYWVGFYTSRPALKHYARTRNSLLQACKQVEALSSLGRLSNSSVLLRQAVALAQHHDAITGTERQLVTYDYAQRLAEGTAECYDFLGKWAAVSTETEVGSFFGCDLLNISVCPDLDSDRHFAMFVYNPLAHSRTVTVHIPVTGTHYEVSEGVLSQVNPISEGTDHVRGDRGNTKNELVLGIPIGPGSSRYVEVRPSLDSTSNVKQNAASFGHPTDDIIIRNEYLEVYFDRETGRMSHLKRLDTEEMIDIDQQILWYHAFNSTTGHGQNSGAYIFRPADNEPQPVNDVGNVAEIESIINGEFVQEVRQKFSPWVYQTIRLYKGKKFVEMEYSVGSIPIGDVVGKEIISRIDASLNSGELFYTDANGREMKVRVVKNWIAYCVFESRRVGLGTTVEYIERKFKTKA